MIQEEDEGCVPQNQDKLGQAVLMESGELGLYRINFSFQSK